MKREKIYFISLLVFMVVALVSCNHKPLVRADLDLALRLSGDNREQLERVLEHYSQDADDSLKLKAAEFLISNMIQHHTLVGDCIDEHIAEVDSAYSDYPNVFKSVLYRMPTHVYNRGGRLRLKYDLLSIESDYLIDNIEQSFRVWERVPDDSRVSFEDFCEYILPYRVKNEPLTVWKDDKIFSYLDSPDISSYEIEPRELNDIYSNIFNLYQLFQDRRFRSKEKNSYAYDCIDIAYRTAQVYRSLGIPIAVDFIPHHAFDDNRHYWTVLIDGTCVNGVGRSYRDTECAKVYRHTFSINPMVEDEYNYIPDFLRTPYIKDVTKYYGTTSDIEYKYSKKPTKVKYGYLAVFNDQSWKEVAWSRLKDKVANFRDMLRGVIYLPTYYDKEKQVYGKYPLLLDNMGEIKELIPNHEARQDIRLKRKFKYNQVGISNGRGIVGVKVIVSNELDTLKFDSISTISSYNYMAYDTLKIGNDKKYKYWAFEHRKSSQYKNFAEIEFYDSEWKQLRGVPFSINTKGEVTQNDSIVGAAFDDDMLTSSTVGRVIGVEFEKAEKVEYIRYISRNDKNGIYPNHRYELLYFENGKWVSLGEKVADDYEITFENVPTNALFWLRNHTEGKEERPFTVNEDGKIRFW